MYTIQRRPPRRTGRRRQWRTTGCDSGSSDGGCIPARQRAVFRPEVDESFADANHDCFSSVDEDIVIVFAAAASSAVEGGGCGFYDGWSDDETGDAESVTV